MFHPWRRFRGLAAWTLRQADLPRGVHGFTDFIAGTVTIDRRLLQVERRCTVAHEIVHIERGPVPADPVLAAREESAVEAETARRLIELHELGGALAWANHPAEAADVLWVTEHVLQVRLDHLHPSERAYLQRRLAFRSVNEEG